MPNWRKRLDKSLNSNASLLAIGCNMLETLNSYHDSRKISPDQPLEYDLVIIGGGAAGITIAKEFANTKLNICLLESGGLKYEQEIEDLNSVKIIGHNYYGNGSRLRYFGGSTNHWGGHCAPLRNITFEKRDWIPYSGWPFGLEELKPYYKRAHKIIELGDFDYDQHKMSERLDHPILPFDSENVETQLSRYHRQRFGLTYQNTLNDADNISIFLYATVTSINLTSNKHRVKNLTVKTLKGNQFTVTAKKYVLATGGIENARILLLNNQDMPNGLGNENDLVGRFFQEHIWFKRGFILPIDQKIDNVEIYRSEIKLGKKHAIRCHLILSEACVRELRIPEFRAELDIKRTKEYYDSVRSTNNLKRSAQNSEHKVSSSDIWNILKDPVTPIKNELGIGEKHLVYGFKNSVEQVPNPNSRIVLNQDKDALGQNHVSIDWQLTDLDQQGIVCAHQLIAKEVGKSNIGRMNVYTPEEEDEILEGAIGGSHHMGTTRMHNDPKQGVVDHTCRIHNLDNMYIGGSSVFPTVGFSNPTLTITALAIRLADHLKIKFSNSQ